MKDQFPSLELKKHEYFPTQIFSHQVNENDLKKFNTPLVQATYQERDTDREGIERSNFRELGGWHSHNNLHKDSRFESLVSLIDACSAQISERCGYHKKRQLKIGTMWGIINPPGSSNRAHIHPESIWSGVYYLQTPENCGNIEFIDPRTQNLMMPPKYIPGQPRPRNCWTKVNCTPTPGKILIFPSWLYHSVDPNLSTEDGQAGERVIISFNLSQSVIRDA